jgi:hypothetical protein
MSLFTAAVIVVGVSAIAITAMLLVRRRAPAGSYFQDGDRAAGVFGVLSTGFAVMLGFVVFLAFESFDTSRSGAEAEAEIVMQQFETAQFMPAAARDRLSGDLICYSRSVVHQEWPAMEARTLGNSFNPWGVSMFIAMQKVNPKTAVEETAFDKWFDQRSDRENARADRVHGAEGVIPVPLWIVLLLSAGIIFLFMLFFADPEEGAFVQATMMGGVAVVISSTLLLLWFLDTPYHTGVGGLRPTAMERTLEQLDRAAGVVDLHPDVRCDERGAPS